MTRTITLACFAMLFGVFGLGLSSLPTIFCGVPPVLSFALIATLSPRLRAEPAPTPDEARRIGRLIGLWSFIEVIGISIVAILLANIGRSDLTWPAAAFIVGLHFLPLARNLPVPSYYATGAALIALEAGSVLLSSETERVLAAGLGSAIVFWITVIVLVLQPRKFSTVAT